MVAPNLSQKTKLKLLIPILYFVATAAFFATTLGTIEVKVHHIVGIIITVIAFILWIVARIQLGNAFSIAPSAKYLVTTGLYSKLRHPVYYFAILTLFGISIFIWSPYLIPILLALVFLEVIRLKKEEALLQQTFGKQYVSYKKQTWF